MIAGLVSTIIPVYNRPQQLQEAVASVLDQDYRPIEIVIVDDGSSDDTLLVAQSLAQAHPSIVHAVAQPNAGPGAARERGRLMARGEFIQYLDSDDVLLPGKFSAQVRALEASPAAAVSYGVTHVRGRDGQLTATPHKRTAEQMPAMFPAFLVSRCWETATPLYRRRVTDLAGPWTDLRLEEDWEYDCRIAACDGRLVWVPHPVCEHRDHGGSRLSRGLALDPTRLRQRAASHALILSHAQRAGIGSDTPEMQHFARALFLLSRQCGAAGLPVESRRLFELSRQACGEQRSRGVDYRAYQAVARVAGWQATGRASQWLDVVRGGR
jgi:hypothetical protein